MHKRRAQQRYYNPNVTMYYNTLYKKFTKEYFILLTPAKPIDRQEGAATAANSGALSAAWGASRLALSL